MSRDDLCYVAQTAPDNLKPIAPCLFYENYSTENAALIERSAGGHGWQILARCTKSGGTAAMGAPWAIEIGAPAMDGSESIVGQPTARLSSDEFAGQGVVILHVVIPASGPPMFDQLAATPSDYVGKTC